MPSERTANATPGPTQRSRVSNGSALFVEGGDGRSAWARRFRDLATAYTSDLGGDLSVAKASIVRRASTLEVQLEQLEARFSEGPADSADLSLYSVLTNTLRRLLQDIGLERNTKTIPVDWSRHFRREPTND